MSLKRNILASYVSQCYITVIGIVMVPAYVHYMGVEAYGLVGFFAMLQAWFQLLDMGLTPTLARETARYAKGSDAEVRHLRSLVRLLEFIFILVALVACLAMALGSAGIAGSWLRVQGLPLQEVQIAVSLMGLNMGLRWISGLYRGAITGFERLVWLSGLNIVIATLRFVLIIPYFIFVGVSPVDFFVYQLVVSAIELTLLLFQAYRLLPTIAPSENLRQKWHQLRTLLRFSMSMAFSSWAWVMVMQSDKLVLSKLLPLKEYAYFSLATLMAAGIFVLSTPISVALLPRLTRLTTDGDEKGFQDLYRETTQLVGVIVIPAVMILAFFAEKVLWVWTGDSDLAYKVAPVLALYAIGNGFVALGAFPYYMQFAKGDLRLHMIATALLLIVLVPVIVWSTLQYGVIGAGCAWLLINATFFLFWSPKVHARFFRGLHVKWLLDDIGTIFLPCLATAAILYHTITWPTDRWLSGGFILAAGTLLLGVSTASSSQMRSKIVSRWRGTWG